MRKLIRFLRENDLGTILNALHSRDAHPVIQFFKYGVCGMAALIVQTSIFFVLSLYAFPALEWNALDRSERANHALLNTGIALIFSNYTAYVLNERWVFTPGRHSKMNEFVFFTLVNAPGVICGAAVQDWLIRTHAWPAWAALAGFLLPNVLINFACRKFFIFRK